MARVKRPHRVGHGSMGGLQGDRRQIDAQGSNRSNRQYTERRHESRVGLQLQAHAWRAKLSRLEGADLSAMDAAQGYI